MLRTATIILIACASMALHACGDDEGACEAQCSGDQIQLCNDDGTLAEATDCPDGQTCSSGHDGMEYVHCMGDDHSGMDGMDSDS